MMRHIVVRPLRKVIKNPNRKTWGIRRQKTEDGRRKSEVGSGKMVAAMVTSVVVVTMVAVVTIVLHSLITNHYSIFTNPFATRC